MYLENNKKPQTYSDRSVGTMLAFGSAAAVTTFGDGQVRKKPRPVTSHRKLSKPRVSHPKVSHPQVSHPHTSGAIIVSHDGTFISIPKDVISDAIDRGVSGLKGVISDPVERILSKISGTHDNKVSVEMSSPSFPAISKYVSFGKLNISVSEETHISVAPTSPSPTP